MAKARPIFAQITMGAYAINRGSILPDSVVKEIGRRLEGFGESLIEKRLQQGLFPGRPDGTGGLIPRAYSHNPTFIPTFRQGDRTRRASDYARMAEMIKMRKAPGVTTYKSNAGNEWLYMPDGYAQFRRLAGLSADRVNLQFTGKLLQDLRVLSRVDYDKTSKMLIYSHPSFGVGSKKARSVLEKTSRVGLAIASITLRVGFATQSSWQVARWQHRDHGNYFAVFTPEEANMLAQYGDSLTGEAKAAFGGLGSSFVPRGAGGQFISFSQLF